MKLNEISELLDAELDGDPDLEINNVAKIETANPDEITFISNPLYEKHFGTTSAGAIIISKEFEPSAKRTDISVLRVHDPYRSFLILLDKFDEHAGDDYDGISDDCHIGNDVELGNDLYIGEFTTISDKCSIGDNTKIYPNCSIGKGVKIGDNCLIYPNVTIYKYCEIGNNVILHSGSVIGCDGFGQARQEDGSYIKIPQNGIVKIEDDVEIGGNCTIDRATIGETLIGKGVKIDNQVQIAHNVVIGEDTVIASQVGIAGSTKIGKRCMIGGQTGIVGHITICDDVMIGASVGVSKSIEKPGLYTGYRAKPNTENLKQEARINNLSDLEERVKNLEEKETYRTKTTK